MEISAMADPRPSLEEIRQRVDADVYLLERALQHAYTGSAEDGSFLRRGGGEYVPSVFLVVDRLRAALRDLLAVLPQEPAPSFVECACGGANDHCEGKCG
jgi:hypothetical protein